MADSACVPPTHSTSSATDIAAMESSSSSPLPPPEVNVVPFCVPISTADDFGGMMPPPTATDPLSDSFGGMSLGVAAKEGGGGGDGGDGAPSVSSIYPSGMPASVFKSGGKGVVGTVTFLGTSSAMVWFGWGHIVEGDDGAENDVGNDDARQAKAKGGKAGSYVGRGLPVMGPLSMATPRSAYRGAFSERESPATQLVSSPSDEDMVLSLQVASRLSSRTGLPILVSCSLHGDSAGIEGLGAGRGGDLSQRAAAMAEREAGRILLRRKAEWEAADGK